MSLQELAAVTQERQIACGLPIGDLRGFGRVRGDASIIQLALDRHAGLLGQIEAGRPLLSLAFDGAPVWVTAYVPGTNVLESTARTETGELRVVDFMALAEGRPGQAEAIAAGRFVRLVTCTEGVLDFDLACRVGIATECGSGRQASSATAGRAEAGWHVACSRPLSFADGVATASVRLAAGESFAFVIAQDAVQGGNALVASALHALGDTIHYWTWWSDRCRYKGEDFDAVLREALGLKLGCSMAGLQIDDPGATGFAAAPLGETTRAADRFLDLGYRHECVQLLDFVHRHSPSSGHGRWACDEAFAATLARYLDRYGDSGLTGSLREAAHVPPPQSRTG
ncbi:MAG TPA: hypothetical protein VM621_16995 [Luteibacter sp.]|uniref:hypothetical protein n=1 Tax=Luteibacter sp. TaxID=1886636 RepID=UPI002C43D5D3|nr:hypothetical protein [Luteibacter sp.]HVI56740.1 hypothetical protein [Luteibacter sp.]